MMKKLYAIISLLISMTVGANADTKVNFTVIDGISNNSVKEKIERTLSRILTEVNTAQYEKRTLNIQTLNIPERVETSLSLLWENTPFICADSDGENGACPPTRSGSIHPLLGLKSA